MSSMVIGGEEVEGRIARAVAFGLRRTASMSASVIVSAKKGEQESQR